MVNVRILKIYRLMFFEKFNAVSERIAKFETLMKFDFNAKAQGRRDASKIFKTLHQCTSASLR